MTKKIVGLFLFGVVLLTIAIGAMESYRDCERDCFSRATLPQTPQCEACKEFCPAGVTPGWAVGPVCRVCR